MRIILICGPSGSGKDTMLKLARDYFKKNPLINFAKRYITRPPGNSEDNFYVCREGFNLLKNSNFFISWWENYGNLYGIPKYMIKKGSCNFISVSREVVPFFEKNFNDVHTIYVTADFDIIKDRINKRNRENKEEIKKRLDRYYLDIPIKNKIVFKTHGYFEDIKKNFILLCRELVKDFM